MSSKIDNSGSSLVKGNSFQDEINYSSWVFNGLKFVFITKNMESTGTTLLDFSNDNLIILSKITAKAVIIKAASVFCLGQIHSQEETIKIITYIGRIAYLGGSIQSKKDCQMSPKTNCELYVINLEQKQIIMDLFINAISKRNISDMINGLVEIYCGFKNISEECENRSSLGKTFNFFNIPSIPLKDETIIKANKEEKQITKTEKEKNDKK